MDLRACRGLKISGAVGSSVTPIALGRGSCLHQAPRAFLKIQDCLPRIRPPPDEGCPHGRKIDAHIPDARIRIVRLRASAHNYYRVPCFSQPGFPLPSCCQSWFHGSFLN